MANFLKRRAGRPSAGWLWVLALLALPDCTNDYRDFTVAPATTLVFCDIPMNLPAPECASAAEIGTLIRQASAAVALNTGNTMNPTLDESPAALAACPGGALKVQFLGTFPQGLPGCADPDSFTDANAFCIAACIDSSAGGDTASCTAKAHPSTNASLTGYPGGCSAQGAPIPDSDPRKNPEPVVWFWDPANPNGVTATGNNLQRTADTSPPLDNPPFDAGAASKQWISHGDAYVEFSAAVALGETTLSHVIGLSEIPDGCADPCTDTDPSLADITFAISLNKDGNVYLLENGALVMVPDADGKGPNVNGSFGPYAAGERFRVSLRQSSDGSNTAIVTYSRLDVNTACIPGNPCVENVFYTHVGLGNYPLRVDTSFREVNAMLTNVVVVRIQ
jgi:hypothetical protein